MTCQRVRRLMPLAAGGDLRPRQAAAFRAHVDACPGCREELEAFRVALGTIKAEARSEGASNWSEAEWNALMGRVRSEASPERSRETGRRAGGRWPRWAMASALGTAVGLAVLFMLLGVPGPERRATTTGGETLVSEGKPQEVLTMTMVSPETGLQIVWFFDRNFDYKGEHE